MLGIRGILAGCVLVLATIFTSGARAGPDDVAVIIGNRTYQAAIPPVEFAHNDAEAMRRYALEMLQIREGNILDLRDATQAQMQSAFGNERTHKGKLWRWIKPGQSRVFVYYSGHGVPGLQDRRGYLLPVDADPDAPEINGYPVDLLYRNLKKLDTPQVTVFLDACFSGESPRGMLIRSASGIVLTPRAPEGAEGLVVLTAAQGNQVASWDEAAGHGLFTRHLLDGLRGGADSSNYGRPDGHITLGELKGYLDEHMTYAARRQYGRVQTATTLGVTDSLIVRRPAHSAGAQRPLPQPSARAVSDGRPDNIETASRWQQPHARPQPPVQTHSQSQPRTQGESAAQTALVLKAAKPATPESYDGLWEVELLFYFNGGPYRYVEELTVQNGKFEEYLDVRDIRFAKHTQRNWVLQGSVDAQGRLIKSVLHYAHFDDFVFSLDGTLEQAKGTNPRKGYTVDMKAKRK